MKKLSIIAVLGLLLSSCTNGEKSTTTIHVLANKSEHEIKLQGYQWDLSIPMDTTVTISIDSQIVRSVSDLGGPFSEPPFVRFKPLVVYFDDTISIQYTWNDTSAYSPLRIENYAEDAKPGKKGGGTWKYTYTFTNRDYEEALNKSK